MPTPPKPHPKCHKVRHHSYKQAVEARNRQTKFIDLVSRDRGSLHVYRCKTCGGFHVGNNTPRSEGGHHPAPYKRKRLNFDPDEDN